jgi:hypothetical protein
MIKNAWGCATLLSLFVIWADESPAQQLGGMGLQFLQPELYRSIPLATPPLRGPLPATADLSVDLPAAGNQGTSQGSCVAWAVGYALKSYHERRERAWSVTDPDHILSPAALYNTIKLSNDWLSGSYIPDADGSSHGMGSTTDERISLRSA